MLKDIDPNLIDHIKEILNIHLKTYYGYNSKIKIIYSKNENIFFIEIDEKYKTTSEKLPRIIKKNVIKDVLDNSCNYIS